MRRLNKLVLVGMLAALGACAVTPQTVIKVETPPDNLLQDCQHAMRPADNTVYGLMLGVMNEREVVETCDWADKAALRAWKAGVTASQPTK